MRPTRAAVAALGGLLALCVTPGSAGAVGAGSADPNTDAAAAAQFEDPASALVVLKGAPLSVAPGMRNASGRVDFTRQATKSAQAQLAEVRNDFRSWLSVNAPAAVITGQHELALNAVTVTLNGAALSTLLTSPQVSAAQYQRLYRPLGTRASATTAGAGDSGTEDPDLSLISAKQAWAAAGTKGDRVKVAIIDTGIDITHPCFSDSGYSHEQRLGVQQFTNNKVIAARVFNNKTPSRGYTPEGLQEHGTHVAGTVACNQDTSATVNGASIPYGISGVAPRALLGNYNVFPGSVGSARTEDVVSALEAAYRDGMDIANMSLGGDANGKQDLGTVAVDNLDAAGMLITVSAGNEGPGAYTDGSPGSAQNALTAGASTVPHAVATTVAIGGTDYAAVAGDFATVSTDLTAPLGVLTGTTNGLDVACTSVTADVTGKIAVLSRGTCSFSTKIRNAQQAGAVAVLVVNNVAGPGIGMGQDGTPDQPIIPAYMLELAAAPTVIAANGTSVTLSRPQYGLQPGTENIMAGFSSQGPVDVSNRVKPDAVAPGVNVLSSIPHQFCAAPPCFAFFQGTSMAAPHLAGSAAVLRAAHPTWSNAQVRSAVTNTADRYALRTLDAIGRVVDSAAGVQIQGGGLENLLAATRAQVGLAPVSLSAGAVPSSSAQTRTVSVTLTNLTGATQTWTTGISDLHATGVTFAPASSSVTIAPGAAATLNVTVAVSRGAPAGFNAAYLTLHAGSREVAHAALFALVR